MYLYIYRVDSWPGNLISIHKSSMNKEKFECFVRSSHYETVDFKKSYFIKDKTIYTNLIEKIKRFKNKQPHFYQLKIEVLVSLCDDIFEIRIDESVSNFLKDNCWKTGKIQSSILYSVYQKNGGKLTIKHFSEELKTLGITKKRTQKGIIYQEITPKWNWKFKKGEILSIDEAYNDYVRVEKENSLDKQTWKNILTKHFDTEEVKEHVLMFPNSVNDE